MFFRKTTRVLATALALGLFAAAPTFAQDNNPPQQQQRRQFDPAQFQQMLGDRLKEALNASDDEIKALMPQIQKIMTLQRDARGGGSMATLFRRGGQGGPGGGGGGPPGGGFGGDPN